MKKTATLLLFMLALSISAQETLLRYNTKVGDTYSIQMKMKQEVGTLMAQTTESFMSLQTIAVTDTTIVNEMKIEKMTMDMIQGQNIINYDSSKSDEELDDTGKMLKAQLAPVLSAVITTTQNKIGQVLDISVNPNLPQAAQMTNQSSNTIFPKEAVSVGSTWSDKKEENGMSITTSYTVTAIDREFVELELKGTVAGMGSGTLSGNMKLVKATGMPVTSSMQMDFDIQGMASKMGVEVEFTKK